MYCNVQYLFKKSTWRSCEDKQKTQGGPKYATDAMGNDIYKVNRYNNIEIDIMLEITKNKLWYCIVFTIQCGNDTEKLQLTNYDWHHSPK